MKVIFIDDVPHVAMAGQTKEVADGYARNYLLPKKLAVLANSAASNIVQAQMKKVEVKRAQLAAEMKDVAGKLEGTEITLKARVGEKERLYGSITAADIAAGLLANTGQDIDKRKIEVEPIREVGTHEVTIRFTHDITAAIKVTVEPEAVIEEKPVVEERKPRAKKDTSEEEAEAGAEAEAETVSEAVAEVETVPEAEVKDEAAEAKQEELEAEAEAIEAELEEK